MLDYKKRVSIFKKQKIHNHIQIAATQFDKYCL
jgi:hypothetical protein